MKDKDLGMVSDGRKPRAWEHHMQSGVLGWVLQKKDASGATVNIWIMPVD